MTKIQMELSHTLKFSGWHIKYNLHEAVSGSRSSSEAAAKKTVVFVHGTPWSSNVFLPLAMAISATSGSRVLLYDLAGYGLSQGREPEDMTKRDANGFVGDTSVHGKSEAHQRPIVIAHDIAGAIALRAHLLHGCEYDGLLLLDTNAVLPWGDGFYKLVRSSPQVFLQLPRPIFEAVVRAAIRSACYTSKGKDLTWEDALAEPWLDPIDAGQASEVSKQRSFVRQIAQANDADVAEMLDADLYKDVRCRVKIMWGEQDSWIPREKMDQLASMLHHCLDSFVVVPEAGHLLMLDQPDRVTAEIMSWLALH